MGLWPRLLARLLAFGPKLLSGFRSNNSECTCIPPQKWREGVYFEWYTPDMKPQPFALIQSGSEEYDKARKIPSDSSAVYYSASAGGMVRNYSLERRKREKGIEIVVPRNQAGVVGR